MRFYAGDRNNNSQRLTDTFVKYVPKTAKKQKKPTKTPTRKPKKSNVRIHKRRTKRRRSAAFKNVYEDVGGFMDLTVHDDRDNAHNKNPRKRRKC